MNMNMKKEKETERYQNKGGGGGGASDKHCYAKRTKKLYIKSYIKSYIDIDGVETSSKLKCRAGPSEHGTAAPPKYTGHTGCTFKPFTKYKCLHLKPPRNKKLAEKEKEKLTWGRQKNRGILSNVPATLSNMQQFSALVVDIQQYLPHLPHYYGRKISEVAPPRRPLEHGVAWIRTFPRALIPPRTSRAEMACCRHGSGSRGPSPPLPPSPFR